MSRVDRVRGYINGIFDTIQDNEERWVAYTHTYSVAQNCSLLASRRSLDVELATVMGLLHDVYSYKTGVRPLHALNGAEMIRVAFKYDLYDLFSDKEQLLIKSAIYHHSDKEHLHDEYDELLKDSDLLQHYLFNPSSCHLSNRLRKLGDELSISVQQATASEKATTSTFFSKSTLADIAEEFATKQVIGEIGNEDYMSIIKYYPEKTAPSELDHAWCAAFVYHCVTVGGLHLPLRTPNNAKDIAVCRFACVIAWYEWGMADGFCHFEQDGFVPERGDIVIYNNIIPTEQKHENSTWCDHIGIVLGSDSLSLTVAEGNVDNQNIAGIKTRKRDHTIGGYIRIPADYKFEGWKTDYKTGEIRMVEFK